MLSLLGSSCKVWNVPPAIGTVCGKMEGRAAWNGGTAEAVASISRGVSTHNVMISYNRIRRITLPLTVRGVRSVDVLFTFASATLHHCACKMQYTSDPLVLLMYSTVGCDASGDVR